MTGFGAASAATGGLSVRVEVRSVNHRHLQAKLRLPAEAAHLEPQLEGLVRAKLSRGSIALGVHLTREGGTAAARIDEEVAAAYAKRLGAMAERLGLDGSVELEDLLGLPGVIAGRDDGEADPRIDKLVTGAVKDALTELVRMREVEGEALTRDLRKHATAITKLVARIGKRMPGVVRAHHKALKGRVEELLGGSTTVDSKDLARELALMADRLDVSEELSRLEAHLGQLESLLAKGGTVGRKLDFLAQEFFREANTIGSKCSDAKVSHAVVDLKTSIERLREQVQNVE
jgi:uncharacterized protein (TIGR00255 family)